MKTLGQLVTDLAAKANIPADNKQLTELLASEALKSLNVPDELQTEIENNLISIAEAKNNHPVIKGHYNGETYNGINAEIDRVAGEMQLPDAAKLVIANEKLATKRIGLLAAKIAEAQQAKSNTNDKTEKATLTKTIDDLQAELRAEKQTKVDLEKTFAAKEKNLFKQYALNDALAEYKTIFDELPSKQARNAALNALINQTLQDKDAQLILDEGNKLKLVRMDGSNVFGDDNRQWGVKTLLEHSLSSNKALKVSGGNNEGNNNNRNDGSDPSKNKQIIVDGNNNDNKNKNGSSQVLTNAINRSLKDLEDAEKVEF